jgi:hypothetical protein
MEVFEGLKSFADKLFWLLTGLYIIFFVVKFVQYFSGIKYVSDLTIYQHMFLKQTITTASVLGAAFLLKVWGYQKAGSLVLAVPAGIYIVKSLLIFLVWLFLAVVFILFGNK